MTYALVGLGASLVALKVLDRRIPGSLYRALLTGFIVLPLAATAYAIWSLWDEWIGWRELTLFLGLYVLTGLGTTLGYHRLVAHGSFETRGAVKLVLLVLGAMNVQGRVVDWAAVHRKHHAHADREGDPHSPLEGFVHAHCGWILRTGQVDRERYARRLLSDPIVVFVDRTTAVWAALGLLLPLAVAGWRGLLWGGLVRIAFTNHVTFAVNSICHLYGKRSFPTRDESRNNWVIGTLALGEGWHNNHHAFPSMAYHGIGRRQLDVSALVLRLLVRLRLAWNVKVPSAAALERAREPA